MSLRHAVFTTAAAVAALGALIGATGCTVIDTVTLPSDPAKDELFITAGDIQEPHETLGLVQATRSGVTLFGFWDVVGTDLDAGFREALIPQIKEMGGDGAVRVRFHMTQYTPVARALGVVFFFVPLPSQVTGTAQGVRRTGEAAPSPQRPLDEQARPAEPPAPPAPPPVAL